MKLFKDKILIWNLLRIVWVVLVVAFFYILNRFLFRFSDLFMPVVISFPIFIFVVIVQSFLSSDHELGQRYSLQHTRNNIKKKYHQEVDFYMILGFFVVPFINLGFGLYSNSQIQTSIIDKGVFYFIILVFIFNLLLLIFCPYLIALKWKDYKED